MCEKMHGKKHEKIHGKMPETDIQIMDNETLGELIRVYGRGFRF